MAFLSAGTAELPVNAPNSCLSGLRPASDCPSLFPPLSKTCSFGAWIPVQVSSFVCPCGYRDRTRLFAPGGGGLCAGLKGVVQRHHPVGAGFGTLVILFSN